MKGFKDRLFLTGACILLFFGTVVSFILGLLDYLGIYKNDVFALLTLFTIFGSPMLLFFSLLNKEK